MGLLKKHWCMMACCVLACASAAQVRCQDASEPHVLFSFNRQESTEAGAAEATHVAKLPDTPLETPLSPRPVVKHDPAVVAATSVSPTSEKSVAQDRRRLTPISRTELLSRQADSVERIKALPFDIPNADSLGTAGAGLVLVVGLFLLCVSLMRRGGPSPTTPLPHDAVAVLGRVPLAPKQYAHLLQVGNKLVLVSISGDRTDTITEITEPAEVERMLLLCTKGSKHSSSAEFQKILGQMAKEPTRGFLGRESAAYGRSARG